MGLLRIFFPIFLQLSIELSSGYEFSKFKETLLKLDFDFLVVAAYGKILPNWMLASPKVMPINVHYSLLPKYRGASPIQSCLLNGDEKTGITFIKMNNKLDEGDCIDKYEMQVRDDHNKVTLEEDLCNLAIENILMSFR